MLGNGHCGVSFFAVSNSLAEDDVCELSAGNPACAETTLLEGDTKR